jgi:hypothetical protein
VDQSIFLEFLLTFRDFFFSTAVLETRKSLRRHFRRLRVGERRQWPFERFQLLSESSAQ